MGKTANDSEKQAFAQRIKLIRESHKMSQKELATILNVSKQTICNWEHGYLFPSTGVLIRLSNYFHLPLDYLVGREEKYAFDITGLDQEQKALLEHTIRYFQSQNRDSGNPPSA